MNQFFDKTDLELTQDVVNALMADSSVNSKQISVVAHDGIVTLYGTVPYFFQKATADTVAQHVPGVRAITDEMEVGVAESKTDQEIARAALKSFRWTLSIPAKIGIKVEKGWVTLTGQADWDFQRVAVQNAVSQLKGVCGVTNDIQLNSVLEPEQIRQHIEARLKKVTIKDSKKIRVTTEGGNVILSGECDSLAELSEATMAAWMTAGVTHVSNHIRLP